jgi:hypothetical protein
LRDEFFKVGLDRNRNPSIYLHLLKFKPGPEARAAYMRYVCEAHGAANPNMELLHCGEATGRGA